MDDIKITMSNTVRTPSPFKSASSIYSDSLSKIKFTKIITSITSTEKSLFKSPDNKFIISIWGKLSCP